MKKALVLTISLIASICLIVKSYADGGIFTGMKPCRILCQCPSGPQTIQSDNCGDCAEGNASAACAKKGQGCKLSKIANFPCQLKVGATQVPTQQQSSGFINLAAEYPEID